MEPEKIVGVKMAQDKVGKLMQLYSDRGSTGKHVLPRYCNTGNLKTNLSWLWRYLVLLVRRPRGRWPLIERSGTAHHHRGFNKIVCDMHLYKVPLYCCCQDFIVCFCGPGYCAHCGARPGNVVSMSG